MAENRCACFGGAVLHLYPSHPPSLAAFCIQTCTTVKLLELPRLISELLCRFFAFELSLHRAFLRFARIDGFPENTYILEESICWILLVCAFWPWDNIIVYPIPPIIFICMLHFAAAYKHQELRSVVVLLPDAFFTLPIASTVT